MTPDEVAVLALQAVRDYEARCEVERTRLSLEQWGHRGAFVSSASPTEDGRREAVRAAVAARMAGRPMHGPHDFRARSADVVEADADRGSMPTDIRAQRSDQHPRNRVTTMLGDQSGLGPQPAAPEPPHRRTSTHGTSVPTPAPEQP